MIALFDANFLILLFDAKAPAPSRPGRFKILDAQRRIQNLVDDLAKKRVKIIIPTPALSEFMLLTPDAYTSYLTEIRKRSVFEICSFDDAACVELVEYSMQLGNPKRKPDRVETWAKLKYDRLILAVAKVNRVTELYTNDDGVRDLALQLGIKPIDLEHLPVPPPEQVPLILEGPARIIQLDKLK